MIADPFCEPTTRPSPLASNPGCPRSVRVGCRVTGRDMRPLTGPLQTGGSVYAFTVSANTRQHMFFLARLARRFRVVTCVQGFGSRALAMAPQAAAKMVEEMTQNWETANASNTRAG